MKLCRLPGHVTLNVTPFLYAVVHYLTFVPSCPFSLGDFPLSFFFKPAVASFLRPGGIRFLVLFCSSLQFLLLPTPVEHHSPIVEAGTFLDSNKQLDYENISLDHCISFICGSFKMCTSQPIIGS